MRHGAKSQPSSKQSKGTPMQKSANARKHVGWFAVAVLVQCAGTTSAPGVEDSIRPTAIITYPAPNHTVINSALNVRGKAKDNVRVAFVYYQLNGTGWNKATTTNGWSNWAA